jgi:hypothetical protein
VARCTESSSSALFPPHVHVVQPVFRNEALLAEKMVIGKICIVTNFNQLSISWLWRCWVVTNVSEELVVSIFSSTPNPSNNLVYLTIVLLSLHYTHIAAKDVDTQRCPFGIGERLTKQHSSFVHEIFIASDIYFRIQTIRPVAISFHGKENPYVVRVRPTRGSLRYS